MLDINFRTKLSILLSLPLIGILFFSTKSTVEKINQYQEMKVIKSVSEISRKIGELVHEIQKERGMTGGFLRSKGRDFRRELTLQREKTDEKTKELKSYLQSPNYLEAKLKLDSQLRIALSELSKIDLYRISVDSFNIDFNSMFGYYTEVNSDFLSVVRNSFTMSTNIELSNYMLAYSNLLLEKEYVGQERGLLTPIFIVDSIDIVTLNNVKETKAKQNAYKELFLSLSDVVLKEFYLEKLSLVDTVTLGSISAKINEKHLVNSFGVKPEAWFQLMTLKINLLKDIEDKLVTDIEQHARELRSRAISSLCIYIIVTGFIIILSIIQGLFIVKAYKTLKNREISFRELNASKDRFFSILAHDLKNPFQVLLSSSELLNDYYEKYDDIGRKKVIKRISSTSNKAYKLLANLLTWSRSQIGAIDYNPESFNLKALVTNLEIESKELLDKKKIHFLNSITDNLSVLGDKSMIEIVLRNLINNAIKFTNQGGEIYLSAQKSNVNNLIEISVKDTGVGIDDTKIKHLFRIDKNYSTIGTEGEEGTGLGLILCKELIKKHNGKIKVKSSIGIGSTFTFYLPN